MRSEDAASLAAVDAKVQQHSPDALTAENARWTGRAAPAGEALARDRHDRYSPDGRTGRLRADRVTRRSPPESASASLGDDAARRALTRTFRSASAFRAFGSAAAAATTVRTRSENGMPDGPNGYLGPSGPRCSSPRSRRVAAEWCHGSKRLWLAVRRHVPHFRRPRNNSPRRHFISSATRSCAS